MSSEAIDVRFIQIKKLLRKGRGFRSWKIPHLWAHVARVYLETKRCIALRVETVLDGTTGGLSAVEFKSCHSSQRAIGNKYCYHCNLSEFSISKWSLPLHNYNNHNFGFILNLAKRSTIASIVWTDGGSRVTAGLEFNCATATHGAHYVIIGLHLT